MMKLLPMLVALLLSGASHAEILPPAGRYDPRVRNATYVDGQVFRVLVGVMKVTSIEFGPGEEIRSIVAGDTEAFAFDGVPGGRALVVKPTISGASTNMTVYTDRRAYYLLLQEAGNKAHFVVRFGGGFTAQARSSGPSNKTVQPGTPWVLYGANVLNEITPLQVWDDGTFTYFKFKRNAPVPAIFKTTRGPEATTNSTAMSDGTMRVSGVSPYWVLRAGDVETVIKRMGTDG
jgi:type IV secretion system protein VirB9